MILPGEQKVPTLAAFDCRSPVRVVYGVGAVERVGEFARELGGKTTLLVTDPGIVAAGHADRVTALLEAAGLRVVCYRDVRENPTTECVDRCVEAARRGNIDAIIGLGGGSSMDTAKGCNFLLTNGGRMQDYWGVGKATRPMLPLIAIPTTGGTGSECQSFALIADETTHQKMACGDHKAAARIAILDPALTVSQPARVTACSGIDAVAHALESAVTRKRTPVSAIFSAAALKLTLPALPAVMRAPTDLEARGAMLLGAAWAGTAIENSMLGAAHSAANPLTAHFDMVHGHAVGVMLPHVIRFNAKDPVAADIYSRVVEDNALCTKADECDPAELLARFLELTLESIGLSKNLGALGVTEQQIPALASEAARQWTAQFNPREVSASDFERLYAAAL